MGHLNQYNEAESSFLKLLGVSAKAPTKNLYHHRPLLELPLADVIESTHADDIDLEAIAFQQKLRPQGNDVRVLARWPDGSAAVTERNLGRGRIFAVGTAMGASLWKTALRPVPWARGGKTNLYNPVDFDESAWTVFHLGTDAALLDREFTCPRRGVEGWLLDNRQGTLLTLINWTNEEHLAGLRISVKVSQRPKSVFSVSQQTGLDFEYRNGKVTFATELDAADYIMLKRT